MGHAHHFLSRLDRFDLNDTAFALSLYREPALVKAMLGYLKLPEGADRVALSLCGEEGPYVVVTRDAGFVTCLGEGYKVFDAPIVSRQRINAMLDSHRNLQEMYKKVDALTPDRGAIQRAFLNLAHQGDRVCREDIELIYTLRPVYLSIYVSFAHSALLNASNTIRILSLRERLRSANKPLYRQAWETVWSLAHITPIVGDEGVLQTKAYANEAIRDGLEDFFLALFQFGNQGVGLRGVWAAAQAGDVVFEPLVKVLHEDDRPYLERAAAAWSVFAIGLRHPALLPAAREALTRTDPNRAVAALKPYLVDGLDRMHEDPEGLTALSTHWLRRLPLGPRAPMVAEKYRDGLVYGLHSLLEGRPDSRDAIEHMRLMLTWMVQRSLPELYLTRAEQEEHGWEFSMDNALDMGRKYRSFWTLSPQARAEKVPGRNEPCLCGSGKKYKKCCEDKPEAVTSPEAAGS